MKRCPTPRFRHDACSDPCRIKRQQQIEHLTIEKLKNDKFNDLTHIAQLIDVIRRNVDTNLTADEMKSLGWAFRDLNIADVHSTQIPYITDKNLDCCGDVLIPDDVGKAKIVADFIGPYRAATPPPSAEDLAAIKPSDLRIDVRNGSGVPGLGAKVAAVLRHDGYVINSVGNAGLVRLRHDADPCHLAHAARGRTSAQRYPSRGSNGHAGSRSDCGRGHHRNARQNGAGARRRDGGCGPGLYERAGHGAGRRISQGVRGLAAGAALALVIVGLIYGGYRVYRRSLPPLPAIVLHDAGLGAATRLLTGRRACDMRSSAARPTAGLPVPN